jgi:hypothetical protein
LKRIPSSPRSKSNACKCLTDGRLPNRPSSSKTYSDVCVTSSMDTSTTSSGPCCNAISFHLCLVSISLFKANLIKSINYNQFKLKAKGLLSIAEIILSYLDAKSLCAAELVCKNWLRVISEGALWKKLIEQQVDADPMWKGLSVHRGWSQYLYNKNAIQNSTMTLYEQHKFYKELYFKILKDKEVRF